jgi:hypothetical protein
MMKRVVAVFSSILVMLLLSETLAWTQVQTRIRIIEASNVGSRIDPSLGDVHDQLGSLFSFTSYKLLRDDNLTLSLNRPVEIFAHKEVILEVTLMRQQGDSAEFRVKIRREVKEILNTQVRLSPGRTVLIGGPKHGDGIIILALSAKS